MIKNFCNLRAVCTVFILILLSFTNTTSGIDMPVSQQGFPPYEAVSLPVVSATPSLSEPIGVGTAAAGGTTLNIMVGTDNFTGPCDLYLAIFAPALDPNNIYLIKSDKTLQTLASGLAPWKQGITGPINESIYGDISISQFPYGEYFLFLLATPAGNLNSYYLWQTSFKKSATPPSFAGNWSGTWVDTRYNVSGNISAVLTQDTATISGTGIIDLSALGLGNQTGTASGTIAGDTITFSFNAANVGSGSGTLVGNNGSGVGTIVAPLNFGAFTFSGTASETLISGTFNFTSPTGGHGTINMTKQ